ncbi:hypothetical protein C2U43_06585 [Citrobacter freundii complex sp. CFNIH9]|nr:hypothetical protein C2U43_06585 [Citrobacter freundii complex sp. CFNIH9]
MMSLWDALRMNMMISYQELVRTFPSDKDNLSAASLRSIHFFTFNILLCAIRHLAPSNFSGYASPQRCTGFRGSA